MYHSQEAQEREAYGFDSIFQFAIKIQELNYKYLYRIQLEHQETRRKRKERPESGDHQSHKTTISSTEVPPTIIKTIPTTIPAITTDKASNLQKNDPPRQPEPANPPIKDPSVTPPESFSLMAGLDPDQANALMAWYWAGYYTGRLSKS